MRLVEASGDLEAAVAGARREAAGAFGDDTVFIERFAPRSRHVEIQIIGDAHGEVCALHERDCSVQRRHQKVIEEAPSPAVTPRAARAHERRGRRRRAGARATSAPGRSSSSSPREASSSSSRSTRGCRSSTRSPSSSPGWTWSSCSCSSPRAAPLPEAARRPPLRGHAIEARLYAEDPAQGFLPVTGTLERFSVPAGVRVDSAVEGGARISPHYDPMIAKVIAHGATRDEAARRLADALRRSEIHGLTTNRDLLVRVLAHDEFLGGAADTGFLDRHDPAQLGAPLVAPEGLRAGRGGRRARRPGGPPCRRAGDAVAAERLAQQPLGARSAPPSPAPAAKSCRSSTASPATAGWRRCASRGTTLDAPRLHGASGDEVDLEIAGVRRRHRVHLGRDGAVFVNTGDGQVDLTEAPRFPDARQAAQPGSLESPLPGRVIRVFVEAGATVELGQPLLIVEAMKMEHEIVAPAAGPLVELRVSEGAAGRDRHGARGHRRRRRGRGREIALRRGRGRVDEVNEQAVREMLFSAAQAVERDADLIAGEIADVLMREVPEISHDAETREDILLRGRAGLLSWARAFLRGVAPDEVESPSEAYAYARALARRGVPLDVLLRIHRLALGVLLQAWEERLGSQHSAERLLAATRRSIEVNFQFHDALMEGLSAEYQRERERWVRGAEALRRETINAILAEQAVETDGASSILGYDLRRHHLGLVIWARPTPEDPHVIPRLERAAAAAVGAPPGQPAADDARRRQHDVGVGRARHRAAARAAGLARRGAQRRPRVDRAGRARPRA